MGAHIAGESRVADRRKWNSCMIVEELRTCQFCKMMLVCLIERVENHGEELAFYRLLWFTEFTAIV